MNDTDSRIQESLLPIGRNSAGQNQQGAARYSQYSSNSQSEELLPRNDEQTGEGWGKAKKSCWWCVVIFTIVVIFIVISLRLFLFKPISKGPPKLDNSTATEPNTHVPFRLLMDGPRNRVMSLVGTSVWTYSIPIPTHPKLQVAAVGLYVERAEGKRRLRRFRKREIDEETFKDVAEVLSRGGMTETLRFVMATTPPSGRMLQWWDEYTEPVLVRLCPDLAKAEFKAFRDFFPDPFEKGDDFSFERREGQDLYGYRKGEDRAKAKRVAGSCMARALFEAQLAQQKKGLVNLLDDFFER